MKLFGVQNIDALNLIIQNRQILSQLFYYIITNQGIQETSAFTEKFNGNKRVIKQISIFYVSSIFFETILMGIILIVKQVVMHQYIPISLDKLIVSVLS